MECFEATIITDRITRIRMPGEVYTYLVKGSERAVLIDTGCGAGAFRPWVEEQLGGMPYEVILTHGHVDHAGGAGEFEGVWMHPADEAISRIHCTKAMREDYLQGDKRFSFTRDQMCPPMKEYRAMAYGQQFELGGLTLEIFCLGGHTPGSVAVLFQEERILLTGDGCCSFTLLFGGEDSLTVPEYRENLKQLQCDCEGKYDSLLYSHPHNTGGSEIIAEMIVLCDEVLAETDARIPTMFFGAQGRIAKPMGPNMGRIDGGSANLAYAVR